MQVLGRWSTDDDLARVVAAIDDPERAVRNAVATALASRKYIAGVTAMTRRMRDPNDRFTMAVKLIEFGPGAAPVVVKLLDDPDDDIKFQAAQILASIGTTAELDTLSAVYRRYKTVTTLEFGSNVLPGGGSRSQ
ncbi:hypothetical protein V5E97_20040 [Singulisphaera sp. Ch08]|uniref:HEAT repeat domain-containing protein n=1 Tax=Singulisphaera sp. Ch08 TaxID=3120278 RepID=A0AAU7CSX8_9BACT